MKGNRAERPKQDMGTGSIGKLLAQLAIPAVVAQIVNLLYNIVDRIYIGHMPDVGADALTGVGLFTPILMLVNAFAMLAGAGGAPRAAIAMGQKDNDRAEKIMGNCFTMLLIFAVVLTAVFYVSAPTLLMLFGASEVTLPYALSYARIYILGSICVLVVMGMNTFITTQGFAKISMMTTVIGAVINIILDPIFIYLLDMGVRGAALATVLSQAVGALWILRFLTGKQTILRLKISNMKLRLPIIGPCLALGISTFVMLSTESLLSMSFTSSLSKYGGDLAVGAMTIITSVSQLVTMSSTALANTTSLAQPRPSWSAVISAVSLMILPILATASMLMPALVEPTFTLEQTRSVAFSASGMESIKIQSPLVQPFCTKAEKPPMKLTPHSLAALSMAMASGT